MKFFEKTTEMIEYLDKAFPHRCPDPLMDAREIAYKSGMRAIIDAMITAQMEAYAEAKNMTVRQYEKFDPYMNKNHEPQPKSADTDLWIGLVDEDQGD